VNLIGVEPPSIADVNKLEELQTVHRILLEGDVLIVEGLCNLEAVSKDYVQFLALPLKIGQGDGAPVRAIIIED
jgi:arylformamidase